jgi:TM2 domain-containing membrane protein YozV
VVGRSHWPILSLLCGLLLPGAGQAYNGKAIRAFFIAVIAAALATWTLAKGHIAVLPLSATVGWQILMAAMAFLTARGIARRGGRFAKGGLVWVFLQFWLVANLLLAVLIGLTMAGLLR